MKKIFKKNQVIITALAIMIAVAGYINYSDTHLGMDKVLQKTGAVSDTSDTEAQETAGTDGIVEEIDSLDYDLTDESALLEENQAAGDQSGRRSECICRDTWRSSINRRIPLLLHRQN